MLTPPTKTVFWVATILAVIGIIGQFVTLPLVGGYEFWLVAVGFVLLWAGNYFKGF